MPPKALATKETKTVVSKTGRTFVVEVSQKTAAKTISVTDSDVVQVAGVIKDLIADNVRNQDVQIDRWTEYDDKTKKTSEVVLIDSLETFRRIDAVVHFLNTDKAGQELVGHVVVSTPVGQNPKRAEATNNLRFLIRVGRNRT